MKQIRLLENLWRLKFYFFLFFSLLGKKVLFAQTAVTDYFSTHVGQAIVVNPVSNDLSVRSNFSLSIDTPPVHGILDFFGKYRF